MPTLSDFTGDQKRYNARNAEHRLIRYTQDQLRAMGVNDGAGAVNPKTATPTQMTMSNPVPIETKTTPNSPTPRYVNDNQYYGNNVPTNVMPESGIGGANTWAPTPIARPPGQTLGSTPATDPVAPFNSGFDGSNTLYDPNLSKEQNEKNQADLNAKLSNRGKGPQSISGWQDPNSVATTVAGAPRPPQDIAAEKAAIEARNASILNQEYMKQAAEREKQKAKEQPTGQTTGEQPKGTPPPGQTTTSAMMRAMGPQGAMLADAFEKIMADNDRSQAELQTLTADMTARNEKAFNDVKSQIEQMKLDAVSNGEAVKELLKEVSDDNQEYIAQQQKAAEERAQWDATKQQRLLAKQQVEQRESMIVQSALFGGFGQDARIREINESDNAFESKIRDVQTELGFARTDIAVKFTGLYLENKNKLKEGLIANLKDTQAQLNALGSEGRTLTMNKANATNEILQNSFNAISALRDKHNANTLAAVKEMNQMVIDDKKAKKDAEMNAYNSVMDSFIKFPAGSKERESAIAIYKASGGKIDFNPKTQTIEEMNKAATSAGNNFIASNIGKYRDAETGDDLAVVISSVISGKGIATADEREGRRNDLMTLMQGGEETRDEFNQLLMNTAYLSLDAEARKQVDSKTQVGDGIQKVIDKISNLTPEQQAKVQFWAKKTKGIKNAADLPNDPEFIKLVSDITYPMASLRKELFGSALTDSELAFSDVFLANPMGEDIADSLVKLQSIAENMENDVTNLYAPRLGSKKLYEQLKNGGIIPTSSPEIGDWNMSIEDSINGNVTGSGGILEPLIEAHIKHEGYGTKGAVSITANNNPGALRWSPGQESFGGVKPGAKKPDGTKNETGFTWFPDESSGRKALAADLKAKLEGRSSHIDYSANPTLHDYIAVYAPAGDRNNPTAYAKAIVRDLRAAGYDVDIDTPLSELKKLIV